MNAWLRDAPIRQKLAALGMIASACALIVASGVFLVATYLGARRQTREAVVVQSAITTDNITAALAFADRSAATDTLRALRAQPIIDVACVWNDQGQFFAAYQPVLTLPCPASPPGDINRAGFSAIEVGQTIVVGGRRVGALYIRANLSNVAAQLRAQAYATVAALLLGALAAIVFATRVQRAIEMPVTALAATAQDISARGDYSVRAASVSKDEIGQLVVAFNDMLEQIQRRDDELRTANRLKDEFLATVSHELRTPLNAILGWLQILQMTPTSEERLQQALASLDRNARAQARLVDDLLDVSRIVAGKLRLKVALVDATQLVDDAIDVTRSAADAKGLQIDTHFAEPPHLVRADPDRLQQAIWNLLANAVKFTDAGRITVSLTHTVSETLVAVQDAGIGIDPLFLPHIFEPFRQADASSTRRHPGLGLGLAIVREVAQAHGGRVEAFSDGIGHGARFVLRLPTAQQTAAMPGRPQRARHTTAVLKGVTALVVDDDPDARELAAMALAERGAFVATAPDAAGALDLIVADLAMPDVDGYGLLTQVSERALTTGRMIPAVAVTAHTSIDEETRALAKGFSVFVRKPYRFDDLVDAVASAVRSGRDS